MRSESRSESRRYTVNDLTTRRDATSLPPSIYRPNAYSSIPIPSTTTKLSPREVAASDIWRELTTSTVRTSSSKRILDVQQLAQASTLWAKHLAKCEASYQEAADRTKKRWPMPKKVLLLKEDEPERGTEEDTSEQRTKKLMYAKYEVDLRRLQDHDLKVPIMTAHTPLDATLRYDDCIWVTKFEDWFKIASGNASPKINTCLGSDGKSYTQLVCTFWSTIKLEYPRSFSISSKAKTIFARMLSWNKSLSLSTRCSAMTEKPADVL